MFIDVDPNPASILFQEACGFIVLFLAPTTQEEKVWGHWHRFFLVQCMPYTL